MIEAIEKRQILAIIFVLIISFTLRLYNLGFHEFWYDEVVTVNYAQNPYGNWGSFNAPLYWLFLHFWIKLFGISEFSLRFPSLIFSFFSVILIYLLGKILFDRMVGIFAAIFMGLSPFHLWYAQEARDYSMALFLGLASSYFLYKALRGGQNRSWLFFIFVSIAALYTNYFFIFLFFAQAFYILISRKIKLKIHKLGYFLLISLGFIFYLPHFLRKFYYLWHGFWIPVPHYKSLVITLENFMLGYSGFRSLYLIADILAGLLFITTLLIVHRKNKLKENFVFSLFLFFVPIMLIFFFSKALFSIYLDRGLIIFSPYFYIVLSLGIVFMKRIRKVVILSVLILVLFIADYGYFRDWFFMPYEHHVGSYIKKPIKGIIKFLEKNVKPEDIIAFTNESAMLPFHFYSYGIPFRLYHFFNPRILSSTWQRPLQEGEFCKPYYKINQLKFKRLWIVSSDWARSGELDENSQTIKEWMDKNLNLEFVEEYDGLFIFRYSNHIKNADDKEAIIN
ncbi:MAG: glycosyltransferase family 39 protein [Candidatus Omnitrophota bacterium]